MAQSVDGDLKRLRDAQDGSTSDSLKLNVPLEDVQYAFVNTQHPTTVLRGLQQLRAADAFCDIVLKGSEDITESLPCHRLVLSSCSTYFRGMFTSNLDETRKREVQLQNICSGTLKELVNYAYTSEVTIDKSNVQSLLAAATFLDIIPVRDACCNFLERNMDESNCLMIHCFAELHHCISLAEKAKTFALQRFFSVSQCSEFLEMAKEKVIDLIASDDLNVEHEEVVYDAAVRWLNHDLSGRRASFAEVLKYVRLPLLSPYFLEDTVASLSVLTESPLSQELLKEARYYHALPNRRPEWSSSRCRLRKSSGFAEVIVCVGGEDDKVVLRSVECFNPMSASWSHLKSLPFAVSKAGLVITGDNFMYLCGGEYPDGSASRGMFRYDPVLDEWKDMALSHVSRSEVGVALVDEYIFAVGGYDRARRLETVEKFDPRTNTWKFVASLKVPISCAAVVSLRSLLYVFGGTVNTDSYEPSNLAFRYDPKNNTWTELARMPLPRSGSVACVAPSGLIYVIGGLLGQETLCRVDAYDPNRNEWISRSDMIHRRFKPGTAVIDGKIFVMGGENYLDVHTNVIEFYSEDTNSWTVHKSELPCSRSWLSCAVMRIKKCDPSDFPNRSNRDRGGWMRP